MSRPQTRVQRDQGSGPILMMTTVYMFTYMDWPSQTNQQAGRASFHLSTLHGGGLMPVPALQAGIS